MPHRVRIKRGASLELSLQFLNDDGTVFDLTGSILASQVRDSQDNLVAQISLTTSPSQGTATVTVADTSQWPTGMLRCDVRLLNAGVTFFSETFPIQVEPGVTR